MLIWIWILRILWIIFTLKCSLCQECEGLLSVYWYLTVSNIKNSNYYLRILQKNLRTKTKTENSLPLIDWALNDGISSPRWNERKWEKKETFFYFERKNHIYGSGAMLLLIDATVWVDIVHLNFVGHKILICSRRRFLIWLCAWPIHPHK